MYRDLTKRIMALALSVCMIAGMVDLSGLTVRAEDAEEDYTIRDAKDMGNIEIDDEDLVYDGIEKTPDVTIEGVSSDDYTVEYKENLDATIPGRNRPHVIITNNKDERDTVEVEFTIQPRRVDDSGCTVDTSNLDQVIVDWPDRVTPEVEFKYNGEPVNQLDYDLVYTNNTESTYNGKASVQIVGKNNFTGSREPIEFTITRLDPGKLDFGFKQDLINANWNYGVATATNGAEPEIQNVKYNGEDLPTGSYVKHYEDNKKAGTAKVWIEITKGPYTGLDSRIENESGSKIVREAHTFKIVKQMKLTSYGDRNIYLKDTILPQPYAFDSEGKFIFNEKDLVLVDPDYPNDTLELGTDYTITSCKVNNDYNPVTGKGTGTVTVTGKGKYTGSRTETFEVKAAELNEKLIDKTSIPTCTYDVIDSNGTEKRWYDVVAAQLKVKSGDVVYKPGTDYDYTVAPVNEDYGTQAGTHKLRVTSTGRGKLKAGDYVDVEYKVKPRSLSEVEIELVNYAPYVYNGTEKCPEVRLTYISRETPGGRKTLIKDVDYISRYGSNTNATEKAEVYAVGTEAIKNFTGETSHVNFTILPIDLTDSELAEITGFEENQSFTYTGREITPSMNVVYDKKTLNPSDYTVGYERNVNVGEEGEAEVTIFGTGNYTGKFTKHFTIVPLDLNDRTVSVTNSPIQQYTGRGLEPEVTVRHSTKTEPLVSGDANNGDYYVRYSNNVNVTTVPEARAKATLIGRGNYKGTKEVYFDITRRSLNSGTLKISHMESGEVLIPAGENEHYHRYTSEEIEEGLDVELSFQDEKGETQTNALIWDKDKNGNGDYTLRFDNNQDVGTALVTIVPNPDGNYSGNYTMQFKIKGNLSDSYTMVDIRPQTYTSKEIKPADATVTFTTVSGEKRLIPDVDYEMQCDSNVLVGINTARATIRGKDGDYYDETTAMFTILPFNLSEPDPEGNEYLVDMEEEYTFCDTDKPIQPEPVVTHNGNELTYGFNEHYYVQYPTDDSNSKVGTGSLTIKSNNENYTGEREITFKINPYDIQAGEAEEEPHVTVTGIRDVVLDDVLDNPEDNTDVEIERDGSVVMSNLQVMYKPVDWKGTEYTPRPLEKDEYTVDYEANDKIGTATITITGKGNFTGTITKTFRIRGDLSSPERIQVSVDGCVYSPAGNRPVPVVTYTYNRETVTLTPDEDYTVDYANNTNATIGDERAKVLIKPAYEEDGITPKNYIQSDQPGSAVFVIEQRDLAEAIETEGSEKDPSLNVEVDGKKVEVDRIEDVYEYTGSDIEPQLHITCDGIDVTAGDDDNAGDYKIAFDYNRNVYTFAEDENGERGERLMPTITVEASGDAEGNYTGNYKGKFKLEFKINPREISENTISTILWVDNKKYNDTQIPEVDYTNGEPVTFPVDPEDPSNTKNDMEVTWSKQNVEIPLEEDTHYQVRYDNNTKIGEAQITISGLEYGNYQGEYKRTFKIMASIEEVNKEEPQYMTLDYNHNVPFGIVDVYPDMTFTDTSGGEKDETYTLQLGEDFEIVTAANKGDAEEVSRNNVNVAREDAENPEDRPKVVIRGIGCYRGTITRYYNIIPKDLAKDDGDITIEFEGARNTDGYENAFVYTGQPIEPVVKVYNHGQLMTPGVDYEVKSYGNNTEISTESRKASVVIEAVRGEDGKYTGNYTGQKTFGFTIIRRPIEDMQMEITSDAQVYNRKAKTPDVEVYYMDGTEKVVLKKSDDYDVTYENNTNAATEKATNAPVVIVTGKGSYGGTLRKTFAIERESLEEPLEGEVDDFDITAVSAIYTGKGATTTLVVKAKDGTPLINKDDIPKTPEVPNTPDETEEPETPEVTVEPDYEIVGYKDNVNAGTGSVTIRGLGNYTGTRDVPFNIIAADLSDAFRVADIEDETYTGSPIKPEPRVWMEAETEDQETREIQLSASDYEFSYENNTNVGTATLIVKGTGNFGGEKRVNFTILPKSMGNAEDGMSADLTLAAIEDQIYTGGGITPDVELKDRTRAGTQEEGKDADGRLVLGKDYRLEYLTNVMVGTASVNIIGINNYTGNIQTQFRILGPMNLADVAKIDVQPYTGNAVTPEPSVSFAGKNLTKGEDYTLAYEDNVAQGTAKITITGQGMYTGEKVVTFDIARDLSGATLVKGLAAAYTYTGKQITPSVLVEDHGRILSNGTDYRASYSGNINVGTATVTITGMGRYNGTVTAQFKITPQNIARAAVSSIPDQIYDGKSKKPVVSVSSDGITLNSGTDYTIVHVDNKKPGKASIGIKGKGNYTGTKTVNYNIVVPKVTGVKVSAYTDSSITFSWKRNKVVSGYEIYNSKNKRVAFVNKNSILKATIIKLKAGSTDTFKVRAFVNSGQYYYSDFVKIKAGTTPQKTGITSVTSSKSKQVTIKWKKIKGTARYEVYRSTNQKGKYKKITTTKKTSYTDKKATGGKTYYYKIRVYKKIGSKLYYSDSSTKSVAAKK